jgi:hypothetical protein
MEACTVVDVLQSSNTEFPLVSVLLRFYYLKKTIPPSTILTKIYFLEQLSIIYQGTLSVPLETKYYETKCVLTLSFFRP